MPPIRQDGADNDDDGLDEAADALLRSFGVADPDEKKKPRVSAEDDEDTQTEIEEKTPTEDESDDETSEETPEDEGDEDEDGEEQEEAERKYGDDEAYVKVTVDGQEHEVAVKDLKRLYGQEASLTQKSQAVADQRKKIDAQGAVYLAQNNALLERAKARLAPYAQLDFLALSRDNTISNEELTALRQEAQKAADDVAFLTHEQTNFMAEVTKQQQERIVETAKASIAELSHPKTGIKGFDEKMYDGIRAFASKMGAPAEVVNNLVDAWAIRLIHKAMQFEKGAVAARSKTKVVNKGPKRVVKTTSAPGGTAAKSTTQVKSTMKKLRQTGRVEDAANAFLARMTDGDDE
jgi:hypothetical protein